MSDPVRSAPFALRIVQRSSGKAAIVYRRKVDVHGRDRLQRVASLSPLAFTAASGLLRDGVRNSMNESAAPKGRREVLSEGKFLALNEDWGARVACYALLVSGLWNPERILRAVGHFRHADPNEAAWWLGQLTRATSSRPLRALRILTGIVE